MEGTVTISTDKYDSLKVYEKAFLERKVIYLNDSRYFCRTYYYTDEEEVIEKLKIQCDKFEKELDELKKTKTVKRKKWWQLFS